MDFVNANQDIIKSLGYIPVNENINYKAGQNNKIKLKICGSSSVYPLLEKMAEE